MRNQSVSDFVATTMDAILKSDQHKALFDTQYKVASDNNAAKSKDSKESKTDSSCADDNEAKKKSTKETDSSCADDNEAKKKSTKETSDTSSADDNAAKTSKTDTDTSSADDEDLKSSAAFDVAIDSLLTASAALDTVGLERSASVSLKLASLVVEAKKKKEDKKKKSKKESKKESKKDTKKTEKKETKKNDSKSKK